MAKKTAALAIILSAIGALSASLYLQRTRTIEGTWLYMFEGSDFFEQRLPGHECDLYSRRGRAGWLEYSLSQADPRSRQEYPRPNTGTYRSEFGVWPMDAFEVKFEGRKRLTPFGGGHLGLWKSEYDVHRMISVTPIAPLNCDVR